MNEEVKKDAISTKKPKDAISFIKKYEDLLKGAYRKIINIVGKQGELLKKIQEGNEFFSHVCLSRSNIYFKIRLCTFLCKFPILKKSTFTSSYFKSNLKLINKLGKANADIFGEKK